MSDDSTAHRTLVRDLMKVGVQTVPLDAPVPEVARLLLEKGLEAVVVLDKEGHGVGVVSRDDLVAAYGRQNVRSLTAQDVMTEGVPQVPPDIPLAAAAQLMRDRGLQAVFLMHNAGGIIYPAGMLCASHLIRHLAARDNSELSDLGIAAARKTPVEMFIEKRDAARRAAKRERSE